MSGRGPNGIRLEPPRDLQPGEIVLVDLVERRVAHAGEVAAIGLPLEDGAGLSAAARAALTPTSASWSCQRRLSGRIAVGLEQKRQDVDILRGREALRRLGRHRLDAFEQFRRECAPCQRCANVVPASAGACSMPARSWPWHLAQWLAYSFSPAAACDSAYDAAPRRASERCAPGTRRPRLPRPIANSHRASSLPDHALSTDSRRSPASRGKDRSTKRCHHLSTRNPRSRMWQQNYEPVGGSLALSALVASIPIAVLFFMLGVRRKPAWMAALTALAVAFVLALFAYGMPAQLALMSALTGAAYGIFPISWIVFSSIMLYRLAVDTGKFEIIKDSVGGLTNDRRLQALFIAFSFGAFIEGAAGFGAPVAVSGAMLAGLGFSPFYAAGICLMANTAPVAFGSIGIPVTTLAGITGLPVLPLSAMVGTPVRDDLDRHPDVSGGRDGRLAEDTSKCCRPSSSAACRSRPSSSTSRTTWGRS